MPWASVARVGTAIVSATAAAFAVAGVAIGYTPPLSASNPAISLNATSGTVGALVLVVGQGFAPNQPFSVFLDQQPVQAATSTRISDDSQTSPSGTFSVHIPLPTASYGVHQMCGATGSIQACAPVTILPSVTLVPNHGEPGTHFTATGAGFPASELVGIYLDAGSPFLGTPGPQADFTGSFFQNLVWPSNSSTGPHQLCGDTGYSGSSQPIQVKVCATFTVDVPSPSLTVTPSGGPPGTEVFIQGTGFGPTNDVFVEVAGAQLANYMCGSAPGDILETDSAGNFSMRVTILPQTQFRHCAPIGVAYGPNEICADTGTAHECSTFTFVQGPIPSASPTASPIEASQSPIVTLPPPTLGADQPSSQPSAGPARQVAAFQPISLTALVVVAALLAVWVGIGVGFWWWRRR